MSIYLSAFGVTSIGLLCLCTFIYLFCFEGCQHIWYWFGAVRYDSNWLNRSIVQRITCHHELLRPRQMCYLPANVMTRLAFVPLLLSFFPPPCAFSFPSILSYWAVLLRLKYWSLLRPTLTWQSGPSHTLSANPVNFLSGKSTRLSLYIFVPFCPNPLLLFYDFEIVSLAADPSQS